MKRTIVLSLFLILAATGCPKAERSAGMALDNANELIDSGSDKVFVDPKSPNTAEFDEEKEESDQRYY